jgi:hypothetical protein
MLYTLLFVLLLSIIFTDRVSAFYLDPGTGSYLIQILAAALLSFVFYFKNFKNMLKDIIRGKNKTIG